VATVDNDPEAVAAAAPVAGTPGAAGAHAAEKVLVQPAPPVANLAATAAHRIELAVACATGVSGVYVEARVSVLLGQLNKRHSIATETQVTPTKQERAPALLIATMASGVPGHLRAPNANPVKSITHVVQAAATVVPTAFSEWAGVNAP